MLRQKLVQQLLKLLYCYWQRLVIVYCHQRRPIHIHISHLNFRYHRFDSIWMCYIITAVANRTQLEMWVNAQLMVALPNIGGALCSTPQSLADAHY